MYFSTLLVASAISAVAQASVIDADGLLLRRQVGSTPEQCESQCQSVEQTVSACTTTQCICTAANINGLAACLQCAANLAGDASQEQQALDSVVSACKQAGITVPDPSITAGSGGSTPTATGGGGGNPFSSASGGNGGGVTTSLDGGPLPTVTGPTSSIGGGLPTQSTPGGASSPLITGSAPSTSPASGGNNPFTTGSGSGGGAAGLSPRLVLASGVAAVAAAFAVLL